MKGGELTDEVRRFILTSVPSIPYLEAVLLLRTAPDTGWDAERVSRRLYVSDRQAADLLAQLAAAGIASQGEGQPGEYRYRPNSEELGSRIDALADAYASNLLGVTELIHSRIDKRAHQFADAFRLRKDS
jgi:hypothetical protein